MKGATAAIVLIPLVLGVSVGCLGDRPAAGPGAADGTTGKIREPVAAAVEQVAAGRMPGPPVRVDGAGRLQVYVVYGPGDRAGQERALTARGAVIDLVDDTEGRRTVQAWIPASAMADVARLEFVWAITLPGYRIAP